MSSIYQLLSRFNESLIQQLRLYFALQRVYCVIGIVLNYELIVNRVGRRFDLDIALSTHKNCAWVNDTVLLAYMLETGLLICERKGRMLCVLLLIAGVSFWLT